MTEALLISRGTKACAACGVTFPTSKARRKFCSDDCQKSNERERQKATREANPDHFRAIAREGYARHRTSRLEAARAYGRSERGRELQRARSAMRRVTEKAKVDARTKLNNSLRYGKVIRGPCRDCGSPETHGHHHDYSRPLDVIWLCPEHHIAEHRRIDNG